ncbi:MAG TPA: asparagine synthase (glutamine-hydrolyzing) [Steroidobacteraceae bacterium]|nr:asparagine synthase (glutamine-hydrolyzing) [Steroidobacteraceae bacterium]
MCGVFGLWHAKGAAPAPGLYDSAFRVQAHRGPDGSGRESFEFPETTLTLAHQRLSIIDLSDAGLQPMHSADGQGRISFNGELYNYLELRAELEQEGATFTSRTDTEVLLTALHRWGHARALSRFNWMGAFAWLDLRNRRLVLACDAGSEKPLYYYVDSARLAFASEIKTVLTLAERKFTLNRDTVAQFLYQGLVDGSTATFFAGIERLEAGTYLEIDLDGPIRVPAPVRFPTPAYPGDVSALTLPRFVDELRELFIDAVKVRLRSDVPVGVLLSGGVDSSSIAAVAHRITGAGVAPKLLSATSDDARFDESEHIEAMERHLGQRAERITLRPSPTRMIEEVSELNWYNDAPVAGLSALAHFRLMERAKQLGLTVILSGQGADEILLGYRKFLGFYLQSLVRQGRPFKALHALGGFALNRSIVTQFDLSDAKRYVPFLRWFSAKVVEDESATEGAWIRGWQSAALGLGAGSLADRQLLDIRRFSVPGLCHYEDRMSMAMSREIRLPFLDSRLIDLLLRAPDDYKLRHGWTKYCFRKAMEPYLPREIAWRKDKKGFSNPEGEWLKHELREQVLAAFSADSLLAKKGIVDSAAMLRRYAAYARQPVKGGTIWYREILAPLSLELWMRRFAEWIE